MDLNEHFLRIHISDTLNISNKTSLFRVAP